MSRHVPFRRLAAAAAASTLVLTAAACSGGGDPVASLTADADSPYQADLASVCPSTVDVQLDWWPQADYGYLFTLIGTNGVADPSTFTYSGPLGNTGVNLAVHAGGAAVGFQSDTALLYKDDSILLAVTSTDQNLENAAQFPTVAVFTSLQKVPLVFYWGDPDWDFTSLEDVRDAGVPVVTVESAPYLTVLLDQGLLDPGQVDRSYQGTPARFVQEDGKIVQQGYLTSEVYQYQHELPEWDRPVRYVEVGDRYPAVYHQLSVRSDRLDANKACLAALVPVLQQAGIDYAHDPSTGNAALLKAAEGFTGSGWELSPQLLDWAAATLVDKGYIADGEDGAYGSLPLERFAAFVGTYRHAVAGTGVSVPDDLTVADFATNEFIDPELHL